MNPSELWRRGHPWSRLYAFGIDHPRLSIAAAAATLGTDLRLLYAIADEIGLLPEGSSVLDVPCGSGVAVRGLSASQQVRYVAADISPAMLERTRKVARRARASVETVLADVTALPFADGEFTLTVSLTGLHCFPDPRAAVAEILRVSDERVLLSWMPSDQMLRYRPVLLSGRVAGVLGPSASVAQVTSWITGAGWQIVELTRSGALAYLEARPMLGAGVRR